MGNWNWGEIKLQLHRQLVISDDALHVHVGLALLFLSALVLRRPPWSRWPVAIVAVVEAVNEWYDMHAPVTREIHESAWGDSLHDFALTMLWPILLWIAVPLFQRYTKRR